MIDADGARVKCAYCTVDLHKDGCKQFDGDLYGPHGVPRKATCCQQCARFAMAEYYSRQKLEKGVGASEMMHSVLAFRRLAHMASPALRRLEGNIRDHYYPKTPKPVELPWKALDSSAHQ